MIVSSFLCSISLSVHTYLVRDAHGVATVPGGEQESYNDHDSQVSTTAAREGREGGREGGKGGRNGGRKGGREGSFSDHDSQLSTSAAYSSHLL